MKELAIHHHPAEGQRGARVRVSYRADPGAQPREAEVPFRFAMSDDERYLIQWYLEEYVRYPEGHYPARAQDAERTLERLGAGLFDAVFGSRETGALYARVAEEVGNTRVVVHASDPEGIALPWELLRDPQRGEFGELARLAWALVRSQPDRHFEVPPPIEAETFNILMVIARPPGIREDAPFQSVARPLLELFRPHRDRIRVDVLRPPTFEQLARVLGDRPGFYHVLHADLHGSFPEGVGAPGVLHFESAAGGGRAVTGTELGALLAGKGVPIVLLDACQSGMARPEVPYPSVGNQILQAGVAGVVAMAYAVYVETGVRFMARLYTGLIQGEELARAVSLAREELRVHPQRTAREISLRDWMVPVLFEAAAVRPVRRPSPGLRLAPELLAAQQAAAGVEIDGPEPPAHGFIGRDDTILELERAFRTESAVLLEGPEGVGKTELAMGFARWWAETGALEGPIFFVSFAEPVTVARICDRVGGTFQAEIRAQLRQEWREMDDAQRRRVSLQILKQQPCLMIWDGLQAVAGFPEGGSSPWSDTERQALRDLLRDLRGGRTKVLLTSRRDEPWLGGIYRRMPQDGLALAEAQELALRVLQRAGMSAARIRALSSFDALLEHLHRNPRRIQAVLPRLTRQTPDELLAELQAGAPPASAG